MCLGREKGGERPSRVERGDDSAGVWERLRATRRVCGVNQEPRRDGRKGGGGGERCEEAAGDGEVMELGVWMVMRQVRGWRQAGAWPCGVPLRSTKLRPTSTPLASRPAGDEMHT